MEVAFEEEKAGSKRPGKLLLCAGHTWQGLACINNMLHAHSAVSDSVTLWTVAPPSSSVHGIFSGKNTGVDCHFLLQGFFPTHVCNRNFSFSSSTSYKFLRPLRD